MGNITTQTVANFHKIFIGNTQAYGTYILSDKKAQQGDKQEGTAKTVRGPLGISNYKAHLEGTMGLGVIPVFNEKYVKFSVIDIDQYDLHMEKVYLKMIKEYSLPLVPFRSKSGGLHLYLFFSYEVLAANAINLMKQFILVLGLSNKTEIFPKQAKLRKNAVGNWINLPYFNVDKTQRYLLTSDGEEVPLQEALTTISTNFTYTPEDIEEILTSLPISDGPPCLQHLYMSKKIDRNGGRNNYLFSLSRYYKTKDDDLLEDGIIEANNRLSEPLKENEILNIIDSAKKSDASYLCSREPLCNHCNKSLCRERRFGIDHEGISNISFGQLTQYLDDPPYYTWIVNDAEFRFPDEQSILSQNKFRELCFRKLHVTPKKIKENSWLTILNNALSNIEIHQVDLANSMSIGAMLREYIAEFLNHKRTNANAKDQIRIGAVYYDTEYNDYYFKAKDLISYVRKTREFRSFSNKEIQDRVREMGGINTKLYIPTDQKRDRCWKLPESAISEYIHNLPADIDFSTVLERKDEEEF